MPPLPPSDRANQWWGRAPRAHWAALVLLAAVWIVYGPATNRVFSVDHLWYFAELRGDTSLAAGLHHYDYAATRQYWKGDDALFRPLVFVWLAVANSALSYHHVWWNLAGLALHVLAGLALYQCLVTIHRSIFALAAAVLFAVSKASMELALWSHLGGYVIAWVCFLVAFRALVLIVRGSDKVGDRVTCVAALTIGSLAHEALAPTAFAIAVIVFLVDRARGRTWTALRACAWLLPVAVTGVLYAFHVARVERWAYVDGKFGGLLRPRNLLLLAPKTGEVALRWMTEVAVPAILQLRSGAYERFDLQLSFSPRNPVDLLDAALAVAALVLLLRLFSLAHLRKSWPLVAAVAAAMGAYIGLINLGRPLADVHGIAYYPYFFNILAMLLVYALVDFTRLNGRIAAWAALVVSAQIVLHAADARATTVAVGDANRNASRYLQRVGAFVDAHKAEPAFAFRIVNSPDDLDPHVELQEGYPDAASPRVTSPRATEILMRRYYEPGAQRYVLDGRELAGR